MAGQKGPGKETPYSAITRSPTKSRGTGALGRKQCLSGDIFECLQCLIWRLTELLQTGDALQLVRHARVSRRRGFADSAVLQLVLRLFGRQLLARFVINMQSSFA